MTPADAWADHASGRPYRNPGILSSRKTLFCRKSRNTTEKMIVSAPIPYGRAPCRMGYLGQFHTRALSNNALVHHIADALAEGRQQSVPAVTARGGLRRGRADVAARGGRADVRCADGDEAAAPSAEVVGRAAEGAEAPRRHGVDRRDGAPRARADRAPPGRRHAHPERCAGGARRRWRSARPIAAPSRRPSGAVDMRPSSRTFSPRSPRGPPVAA